MRIQTGRDPFARQDIRKAPIAGVCRWCGQKNRHGKVWKYRIEHDAGGVTYIIGEFCSIGCLNDYHG
jgi:hypothetical protein